MQEVSLFYEHKYDCAPAPLSQYEPKFDFDSPHSFVLKTIPAGSSVMDLGCAGGYVGSALRFRESCFVTGVDEYPLGTEQLDRFFTRNLNQGLDSIPVEEHDYVLLLDVIEHLASPEKFLDQLPEKLSLNAGAELIISTANIGFFVIRFVLLFGQFNYGKRGILDITHTRLFTFGSLKRILDQAGFDVLEVAAMPDPFPLALGKNALSMALLRADSVLNKLAPSVFAYQMLMRVKARPTVQSLLMAAQAGADQRAEELRAAAVGSS